MNCGNHAGLPQGQALPHFASLMALESEGICWWLGVADFSFLIIKLPAIQSRYDT